MQSTKGGSIYTLCMVCHICLKLVWYILVGKTGLSMQNDKTTKWDDEYFNYQKLQYKNRKAITTKKGLSKVK